MQTLPATINRDASTFELARRGVESVQALAGARPRERHRAASRLHDLLAQLEKQDRVALLHGVDVADGVFAELLTDRQGLVRAVTVRLVGYTGNKRWVPLLTALLEQDRDPFVRTRAVEALGHLGDPRAIPTLARVADDRSHPARYHAVRALGQMLPMSARDLFSIALENDDPPMRRVAAETLARDADGEVWGTFMESARDARPAEVRKTVVEGLSASRSSRAAAIVVRMLADDPCPDVRAAAAQALATLRDARTLGALFESALYDPFSVPRAGGTPSGDLAGRDYPVREAAAEAVLMLGGEAAWEELAAPRDSLVSLPEGHRPETRGDTRV